MRSFAVGQSDAFCVLCPPEERPFRTFDPVASFVDVVITVAALLAFRRWLGFGALVAAAFVLVLAYPLALLTRLREFSDAQPVVLWAAPLVLAVAAVVAARKLRTLVRATRSTPGR